MCSSECAEKVLQSLDGILSARRSPLPPALFLIAGFVLGVVSCFCFDFIQFLFFIFLFQKYFFKKYGFPKKNCAHIHGHCFTTEAGCHISSDFIWFWVKAGISAHLRLAAHGAHMVGRWGPMWGPHRQTLGCTTPGWTQRVGPPSFKPPRGLWRCQYLTKHNIKHNISKTPPIKI